MKTRTFFGSVLLFVGVLMLLVGAPAVAFEQYSFVKTDTPPDNPPFYNGCRTCHGDFNSGVYADAGSGTSWGDHLMAVHRDDMVSGDCSTCHGAGPNFPVRLGSSQGGALLDPIGCSGCHGRFQDGVNPPVCGNGSCQPGEDYVNCPADCAAGQDPVITNSQGFGAGLRQHHWNANRTVDVLLDNGQIRSISTRICGDCHNTRADITPLTDANPANFTPVGEDFPPPYEGDPDGTVGVHPLLPRDPCADPGNAITPEEEIVGDALALDNDGDGNHDTADTDCGAVAAAPGETSGAALAPLLVTSLVAGDISISYGNPCEGTDNALIVGPLSGVSTYDYTGGDCNIGNTGTHTFAAPAGSIFFLVVGNNGGSEGSYGLNRTGAITTERPSDDLMLPPVCAYPQDLPNRCD